jgi:hypothetical protein
LYCQYNFQLEFLAPRDPNCPDFGKDRPKKRKSFVRAMWKRAFKNLVSRDKSDDDGDAGLQTVPAVLSSEKV